MPDSEPRPRPHIDALLPYPLAGPPSATGRRPIMLNQNENAARPSEAAIEAAIETVRDANRYPEGDAATLRHAIAKAENIEPDRVICASGSMELISLLAQAYLAPGDEAVVSEYGYLFFRTAVRAAGAAVVIAPENGLRTDVEALLRAAGPRTRMVLLANPNNPTGSLLCKTEILNLRASLRSDIILVLDGAYAEYVLDPAYEAGARIVARGANTVMLRTFSKIHGLAGLRIGWGYFPAPIALALNRIRLPNAIGGPALAAAVAALADREHVEGVRRSNAALRAWFEARLREFGFAALPGHGNFVLIPFGSAHEAADADAALRREAIFVRPMEAYGLDAWLRITIGTKDELRAVYEALRKWRGS